MNTLAVTCEEVLRDNDRGTHTVPSPGLYPHQWLWDSCFSAIGWAHIDPERAKQELISLVHGQWHNGMMPHMIFSSDKKYAKDRNMWRSWIARESPNSISTSGITQPPLLAEAVQRVGESLPSAQKISFYKQMLPVIESYHNWLYKDRDPHKEGLVLLIHPYETGLDSTPPWIEQQREHSRPTWIALIDKLGLENSINLIRRDTRNIPPEQRMLNVDALMTWDSILRLRRKHYDINKILHRSLFAIEDIGFNAILIRNNEILQEIASSLGRKLNPDLQERIKISKTAIEQLWLEDFGVYFSRDFITNQLITIPTISCLLPLYAGTIEKSRADLLVKILFTSSAFWPNYPVPSVPKNSRFFDENRYWQGPTWVNTNWLIIDGLKRMGYQTEAQALTSHTLEMVRTSGIWEYYNPSDGQGLGSPNFSWTASLTLDLLNN